MIISFEQCPICGKLFELNSFGRPKKYCSLKCRKQAELEIRKEKKIVERKCKYCGKMFEGNGKRKYCSSECYEKANQDLMNKRNSYRWHHDVEYRKRNQLQYGGGLGTINFPENEYDWEKELIIIKALKKQAGLD